MISSSLACSPGPLRQLLGLGNPLTTPADFAGKRIGISPSWVAEQTFTSLGATAVPSAFEGTSLEEMNGIEQQVDSIANNQYGTKETSFTANVVLWPRPLVVFMRKDAFENLSADAQAALRGAAADAVAAMTAHRAEEARDGAAQLCAVGVHLVDASADDAVALRRAVQPVYDALDQDPLTRHAIEEIDALKAAATDEPPAFACPQSSSSPVPSVATPIDGTWQMCDTRDELLEAIRDPKRGAGGLESDADDPQNYGCITLQLDHGTVGVSQGATDFVPAQATDATYMVDGDQVAITWGNGEVHTWAWSLFKDTLTLAQVPGKTSPTPLVVKPFHRAGG